MNKFYIKLNEGGFCTANTILPTAEDPWIELSSASFAQSERGRKFDSVNQKWLDEWDESLIIKQLDKPEEPLEVTLKDVAQMVNDLEMSLIEKEVL